MQNRPFLVPIHIDAEHLDDAYWQAIRQCFEFGYEYEVTHGSYVGQKRYEFDHVTILIKDPAKEIVPIMPEGCSIPPPASKDQIATYMADYLMADALSPKEDYRYGERLVAPKFRYVERPDISKPHIVPDYVNAQEYTTLRIGAEITQLKDFHSTKIQNSQSMCVNQIDEVVHKYAQGGVGNNQCTMEIAMPNDILLNDPPCCRLIDTRIRYNKLHFVIYFRSWDLFAGFPVNLGGMELLKQYMVDRLNESGVQVENGCMIVMSKGLHIYSQYYDLIRPLLQVSLDTLRKNGYDKIRSRYNFLEE